MSYADIFNFQRIKTLINLALITFIAYFGVSFFYQMVAMQLRSSESQPSTASAAATASSRPTVKPYNFYNPVLERDLFKITKTAQTPAEKPSVDVDALEATKLNLKLWGTVSGDSEKAYAVIEDLQKREQNLYRVGDTVQNAVVKMVMREKVILSVNGKDEILGMEEMDQAGGPAPPSSRFASRGAARPMVPTGPREQRITIQRAALENAMQDVGQLMTQIALRPHMNDGVPEGLAVSQIKPNSIFRRLGLRNGDVLVGLNGQEIRTVDDAMALYESLKSQTVDQMALQIKRRGQDRTINYNIR